MAKKYTFVQCLVYPFLLVMLFTLQAKGFTWANSMDDGGRVSFNRMLIDPPTITGFSPGSGQVGTVITLTGTNLDGATSVLFGGLPATSFTVSPDGMQLTVTVPRMASTQHLRVTTPSGTAVSPDAFRVTRVSSSSIIVNFGIPILTGNGSTTILTPGTFVKPTATDLDGDGLIDLLVGNGATGRITHYEQSSANSTNFNGGSEITSNGSTPIDVVTDAVPTITDLDGDGLLDLLVGNVAGTVQRFEQTTANGLIFSGGATLTTDGVTSLSVILRSAPTVTDLDGDGLLDLLVGRAEGPADGTGSLNGQVLHFEQTTPNGIIFAPRGTLTTDGTTPLDAGANAIPVITDIDGDGLLDLLVGNLVGTVLRYEQSSVNSTVFSGGALLTGYNNTVFDPDRLSAPTVTDVDGDGLLDILVGNANGAIVRAEQPVLSGFALAGSSNTVCVGSVLTFTAAVGLGKSYTLTSTAGHNLTGTVSSPGFSQTLIINRPDEYLIVTLLVKENGFTYSDSQILTAGPALKLITEPMAPPAGLTVGIGQSISLTASLKAQSAQSTFQWSTGSNASSIVSNPVSSTAYSVTATDGFGCTAVSSVTATVISIACGPVIHVTVSGSGTQDGSSWANALPGCLLQTAINWAGHCGSPQVWVAAGLYTPISVSTATDADRAVSFSMRNNVAIYGGFAGSETALSGRPAVNPVIGQPSSSTLSGDIGVVGNNNDNSNNVVHNSPGRTNSAVIDGFVFMKASGSNDNYPTSGVGIVDNDGSYSFCDPVIRNCLFDGQGSNQETLINVAWYGGTSGHVSVTVCLLTAEMPPFITVVLGPKVARFSQTVSLPIIRMAL